MITAHGVLPIQQRLEVLLCAEHGLPHRNIHQHTWTHRNEYIDAAALWASALPKAPGVPHPGAEQLPGPPGGSSGEAVGQQPQKASRLGLRVAIPKLNLLTVG